jgi:hypothetical protein
MCAGLKVGSLRIIAGKDRGHVFGASPGRANKEDMGLCELHGRNRGSICLHDAWRQLHRFAWKERLSANDQTTRDRMHAPDRRGAARTKSKAPAPSGTLEVKPDWCERGGWTRGSADKEGSARRVR